MNVKMGSDAERVKYMRIIDMIKAGINKETACLLGKSPTRNTIAGWYLDQPLTKKPSGLKGTWSDAIDKLAMAPSSVPVENGFSRRTKLFPSHGIVIKCDHRKHGNSRQGLREWYLWDTATDAQRDVLCPIAFYSPSHSGKVDDETSIPESDRTCRTGSFGLTVMPYCIDVGKASQNDVSEMIVKLQSLGLQSWDCKKANMGRYNGKWVMIDYGVD